MNLPESICKLKVFEDWWMEDGRWKFPGAYEPLFKLYQIYRFPEQINGDYFVPRQDKTALIIGVGTTVSVRNYLRVLVFNKLIYPFKCSINEYGCPNEKIRIEFWRN
jgi:hypothetical protein